MSDGWCAETTCRDEIKTIMVVVVVLEAAIATDARHRCASMAWGNEIETAAAASAEDLRFGQPPCPPLPFLCHARSPTRFLCVVIPSLDPVEVWCGTFVGSTQSILTLDGY
jgi:hypothetical protein